MSFLPNLSKREWPLVFYVTDRKGLPTADTADLLEKIRDAAAAGCDFVQIREKDLSAKALLQLARGAVSVTRAAGSAGVVVNDRLDVAIAAGAHGVHLGGSSLAASDVIPWCRAGHTPANFLVGVSCHSLQEVAAAERSGASCVFYGPVFDTPSKRSFGSPQGLERLRAACREVRIPVVAIGGVDEKNAAQCVKAGAAGIAAIRMFQQSTGVESLRTAISRIHAVARE
ncbi:MAG TPA: thiamine phosphate synthase [Candidatus Acidoferrales bacterium]|nr:thiamine phosphate synthase [Candidatus Acidoferrales bacterium]